MKRFGAAIATAVILAVALLVLRSGGQPLTDTPEACLEQMSVAMRSGDAVGYLDCFTGELRERLERSAKEDSYGEFSEYLRRTVQPVKGRAILHHKTERAGPDRVRMVVERVYAGRQWEKQAYRLHRERGVWKIYAIDPAEVYDPPVPYGTPVLPATEQARDLSRRAPGK